MTLKAQLESILFMSPDPLTIKRLAELTKQNPDEVEHALAALGEDLRSAERGVMLLTQGKAVQLVSHPDNARLVERFIKSEMTGELTRPQLETLTIIAYRGPIGKAELDAIRGVNCAIILRNLLMRGLVIKEDVAQGVSAYAISMDFLRHLGLARASDLPNYETLSSHELIDQALKREEEARAEEAVSPEPPQKDEQDPAS